MDARSRSCRSFCGVLALFAFLHYYPVGDSVYGAFSPSAQVAVLVGQIVVPSLGGPLLGVALGRWVRFPGAAFVLFLVIFGWVNLATARTPVASGLDARRGAAAVLAVRVLHGSTGTPPTSQPGAGRRGSSSAGSSPCARSRSWWRSCAGPRGRHVPASSVLSGSREWRPRSCSCWPAPAGSPTPSPRDDRTGAAGRGVARRSRASAAWRS